MKYVRLRIRITGRHSSTLEYNDNIHIPQGRLSMYPTEDILECGYDIRPALEHLLGEQATVVEQQLMALLTRAAAGEKADTLILDLLSQYQPAKEWARRYLKGDQATGWIDYSRSPGDTRPPGQQGPVFASGTRYFCPWCGLRWIRREAGQMPPAICPNDNKTPMQPVTTQARNQDAG
jgi:hypothetical protein